MRKTWIGTLVIAASVLGCSDEYQRKVRAEKARNESLKNDLAASEEARKKAEAQAGSLQTTVESQAKELAEKKALLGQQAEAIGALSESITEQDKKIAVLKTDLSAKEAEIARLHAVTLAGGPVADELKAELAAAEKARDQALSDLSAATEAQTALKKSLEDLKTKSIQAFLENAAPETMFAADASDMANLFKLDGKECVTVLDIGRDVEILRGTVREQLPNLQQFDVLPMRVAYKKVLVCKQGGQLQVDREEGFLLRLMAENHGDGRAMVTGREQGSCDRMSAEIIKDSVFGENKFQIIAPYRGSIDGIETIDLPRGDRGTLRLNMGSAVIGATSCAKAMAMPDSDDLAMQACKVLLGQSVSGLSQVEGCFSEKKEGDAVSLIFNP